MISTTQFVLRTRSSYFAYAHKVFCVCPQGVLRRLARLRDRLSVLARRAFRPCRTLFRTPANALLKLKRATSYNLAVKELHSHFSERRTMALLNKMEGMTKEMSALAKDVIKLAFTSQQAE